MPFTPGRRASREPTPPTQDVKQPEASSEEDDIVQTSRYRGSDDEGSQDQHSDQRSEEENTDVSRFEYTYLGKFSHCK